MAAPKNIRKKAASAAKTNHPSQFKPKAKRGAVKASRAKINSQRFGDPNERLRHRLAMEAKQDMTPINRDDELLRVRDAAARLKISHHTMRTWALAGKCVYRRVGGLLMMIPESEIERLRNQLGN